MSDDLSLAFNFVTAHRFRDLAQDLRAAGRKDLKKEMTREIRAEVKPAIGAVREHAREELPRAGGLAALIAKSRFRAAIRTGKSTAGVRVLAKDRHDIRSINRGKVRHPVWGNRKVWVLQSVQPGWFDEPLYEREDAMREAISRAVDRTLRELG